MCVVGGWRVGKADMHDARLIEEEAEESEESEESEEAEEAEEEDNGEQGERGTRACVAHTGEMTENGMGIIISLGSRPTSSTWISWLCVVG